MWKIGSFRKYTHATFRQISQQCKQLYLLWAALFKQWYSIHQRIIDILLQSYCLLQRKVASGQRLFWKDLIVKNVIDHAHFPEKIELLLHIYHWCAGTTTKWVILLRDTHMNAGASRKQKHKMYDPYLFERSSFQSPFNDYYYRK